ncbi:MAG: hypothetical protein IPQ21_13530 [Betaproteobacteria bacterium]|nr:hypothetical protein [Betaproteobacteria bacterium]
MRAVGSDIAELGNHLLAHLGRDVATAQLPGNLLRMLPVQRDRVPQLDELKFTRGVNHVFPVVGLVVDLRE